MNIYHIIIDTNVLVTALRSKQGTSFRNSVITPKEFLQKIGEIS